MNLRCIAVFDLVSRRRIKFMKLSYAYFGEPDCPDIVHTAFSLCRTKDRLCAWAYYNGGYVVDMWMLKEYDVWESWTRLFCGDMRCEYWNFFGLTKAREVMMFHFNWLVLIDFSRVPLESRSVCFGHQVTALNYVMGVRAQIPYCRRKIDSSSSDVNRNRENRFINDGFRRELAGLTI
ncbi:uncharacterized protein LOC110694825 isoform X1 [Chenopodium quinoa]|uniref:uncharacterized protein LOC110694825 isoform X1 n=1 Tax=Chenopodium quinoa TaxID=63459 RepID=UPI000B78CB78|nr:uncharacterized protein LOC110694825 isoform X1 [Chenopodium quinoa]